LSGFESGAVQDDLVIRDVAAGDLDEVLGIINVAAEAYRGRIPADLWHEPYMSREQFDEELAADVRFVGAKSDGTLVGVMALQPVLDVQVIRHAYVLPRVQGKGVGGELLAHLRRRSTAQFLVGTWAAATWAIRFYERNGFERPVRETELQLLRRYWRISKRHAEESVALASPRLAAGPHCDGR
jgi:N-acetylglutamate synthase-like GNAT family acetyltransferase